MRPDPLRSASRPPLTIIDTHAQRILVDIPCVLFPIDYHSYGILPSQKQPAVFLTTEGANNHRLDGTSPLRAKCHYHSRRSPSGLRLVKLFPSSRVRRPARANSSGGPNVLEARWRTTTVWDQITMSTTRRKSRIRGSKPRLRMDMMRTTTTGPQSSIMGRRPLHHLRLLLPSTNSPPTSRTMAYHTTRLLPTTHTLIRFSRTHPISPVTPQPGTWDIPDHRILAPARRPMPSSRRCIQL